MRAAPFLLLSFLIVVFAVPADGGPTPQCQSECTIPSAGAGYLPPVMIVTSGASVTWESLDSTHINLDGITETDDWCFHVAYGSTGGSAPVTFRIEDDAAVAQVGDEVRTCVNATATPAGFVLPYYCSLHPPMRGTLIITDA